MNSYQKIYLTVGIFAVIVVSIIGFLICPLAGEIKKESSLLSEDNQKLLVLKKIDIDYLRQIEFKYKKIKEDLGMLKINLSEKQIIDFIVELEKAADNTSNDLKIKSAEYPIFDLVLTGSFDNLMKFIGWLENNSYLISIESMQARKLTEGDLFSQESKLFSIGDIRTILQIGLPSKQNESR
ncbi:MAG: hypothetical protein V1686_01460 [Patescibacteria group bacterium]